MEKMSKILNSIFKNFKMNYILIIEDIIAYIKSVQISSNQWQTLVHFFLRFQTSFFPRCTESICLCMSVLEKNAFPHVGQLWFL